MSKIEKLIQKMRNNPKDWKLDNLETIAKRAGLVIRKSGGSHVVFAHETSNIIVTVPAKRPIKSVYIIQFLELIDDVGGVI